MDMSQILDEKMVCNNAAQAEASIKKHEAISAEILARVSVTCLMSRVTIQKCPRPPPR